MKRCFKCGIVKPISEFYRHSAMTDGHLGKCKDCARADTATRATEKREEIRRYDRKRQQRPERRLRKLVYQARGRRSHPEKSRARGVVSKAIKSGRLVREPCRVCGNPKSEAHHEDYSKPLEVIWLCLEHHREHHK